MKKIIYIWLVKLISKLKHEKKPENIVYLMSFNGNVNFIKELSKLADNKHSLTVLYLPQCQNDANKLNKIGIKTVKFQNNIDFLIHKLPFILNAQLLICDNYYAFLSGIDFDHDKTHVVQIWHANGAVKSFGWDEPQTLKRSKSDKKRFQRVYNQFDEFIVGSTMMGEVFQRSYHISKEKISLLGYPRTDNLFNCKWQSKTLDKIYYRHPELKGKEILLYAPTYREDENHKVKLELPIDLDLILKQLNKNQKLIIKLHPHLIKEEKNLKQRFQDEHLIWIDDFSTNDLLLITDRLITDYSSVIFDYTLLPNAKQIILYCYDFKEYKENIGIQKDFQEWAPGPIVTSEAELNSIIKKPLKRANFDKFNIKWNTFNDGNATERVIKHEENYLHS